MKSRVTDLKKEEIAKLFPVVLSPSNAEWAGLFENEKQYILEELADYIIKIEHFGSTAIPYLIAKDTIDIIAEIKIEDFGSEEIINRFRKLNYDYILQHEGSAPHMIFVKGYSTEGEKGQTYHVHMAPRQHAIWDRILFRDYLIEKPEIAKAYEELKIKLAEDFKYDRVGYRIAKTNFIQEITSQAKNYYKV